MALGLMKQGSMLLLLDVPRYILVEVDTQVWIWFFFLCLVSKIFKKNLKFQSKAILELVNVCMCFNEVILMNGSGVHFYSAIFPSFFVSV